MDSSKALQFVNQMGWNYHESGQDNIVIQVCPFCNDDNFKFYMNVSGGERDGTWDCKRGSCGVVGNLYQLQQRLGVRVANTTSLQDAANTRRGPEPLPDFDILHRNLKDNPTYADVLEYLLCERKFTPEVIDRLKLGATTKNDKLWYVIPYFNSAGQGIYYKMRTVPPAEKDFSSPYGREAPLYNEQCVRYDMDYLIITEGEADCIALLAAGEMNVVGVPGATTKKAIWIELLDRMRPKTIYLLYDRDDAGQKNAKDMAIRIGLDRCKNILLPEFGGKDINEWLAAGHTLAELGELMANARPFDVDGIHSVSTILTEIEHDLETKSLEPTYLSPWPDLNERWGGAEDGDLVGVMAEAKVGKTTLAMNWLDWFSQEKGLNTALICNEMLPKRQVRKWISMVTQTPDNPLHSQITKATIKQALDRAATMAGDILFGYEPTSSAAAVFSMIRQVVRRYGTKVVCFDNLQLLCRSVEHATTETAKYIAQFKALAMELNILIILIIQPHRVAEGTIIGARNAANTSAIEKFVDSMICLHRNRVMGSMKSKDFMGFIETEETFEPAMLAKCDLTRFANGGMCTLYMDGETSTIRNWDKNMESGFSIKTESGYQPMEAVAA